MSVSCDYDPASVYNASQVRARVEHTCCECHGKIAVGERHELVKGCWDGHWSSFRTCPDCVHLRCEISRTIGGGCGWLHGGMQEQMDDLAYNARVLGDESAARLVAMYNAVQPLRGAPSITVHNDDDEAKPEAGKGDAP